MVFYSYKVFVSFDLQILEGSKLPYYKMKIEKEKSF